MISFENVYIFVSDALRLDHLPEVVRQRGKFVSTVASSTISPTSFASIVSGLHPPEHGVRTFYHNIDNSKSILHIDEYNTSFWQVILEGGLYDVLGQDPDKKKPPDEIEPPFVYIERENSTHAPYNEWTEEHFAPTKTPRTVWGDHYKDSMWERYSDWESLRQKYAAGAETAAERFLDRVEICDGGGCSRTRC